jgi:formate dehydrogenase maturation protein FdhE
MPAVVEYPLKFFNSSSHAQALALNNPGYIVDSTIEPDTLLPVCGECNTGAGIIRDEGEEGIRYRCVICGYHTKWHRDRLDAIQQWADDNSFEDDVTN